MLLFAISATVRNFLSTLPFSFLLSRVKRKMYLLSPYQQRGRPSGLVCVCCQSYEMRIFENHWTVVHPPSSPATPTPTPIQQPGNFLLWLPLFPASERISVVLGGLHTRSFVQESGGRTKAPCMCRRGSLQDCWLGTPARIKSKCPPYPEEHGVADSWSSEYCAIQKEPSSSLGNVCLGITSHWKGFVTVGKRQLFAVL